MPTPMDALLGLVVASIGLMILVQSFTLAEPRKKLAAYFISGFLVLLGGYYYLSSEMRGYQMRRRISEIQQRQSVNIDEIRQRLQAQSQDQGKQSKTPGAR